jgi:galactosylgalactosylxylosylprotein 3-beta-glucuronosyltransferase 3
LSDPFQDPNWSKPRGVEQRNAALDWLRHHWANQPNYLHCLVFFMDDDNVYSTDLFAEMAKIEPGRVGVWPVGLVGALYVEKPVLNANHQVTGFNSLWRPERPFPVDMAGFAISGDLLIKHPEAKFTYEVQRGYQESEILRHVTVLQDLQPLARRCTQILVWHTRTEKTKLDGEVKLQKMGQKPSDFGFEV